LGFLVVGSLVRVRVVEWDGEVGVAYLLVVEIEAGVAGCTEAGGAGGGGKSKAKVINKAITAFPFAIVILCRMHICRLLVAMRQAQNTAITSPGITLPSLTSLLPNQKPCTNMPIITK
jgi:hypothetical protein